jgi:hypothetical protein
MFVPGPPVNDLESAADLVSAWLGEHEAHPDVAEAQRWLAAAAPKLERLRKERELANNVADYDRQL